MHELALFAGAGGGLLATQHLLGWQTVCYVENAAYPARVLKARIQDGYLDDAPIWGDVRTFDGTPWRGCVDIVTAGFPCQPFSRAGKGHAERDDRNLWPDTIRIIREVRPEWVLLENVSRLLSHAYVRRIYSDLAQSGYNIPWDCIPASAIGANHQRDRLWIVAYANSDRGSEDVNRLPIAISGNRKPARAKVAYAASERCEETRRLRCVQSEERVASGGEEMANADSNGRGRAGWRTVNTDETKFQTQPKPNSSRQTMADAHSAGSLQQRAYRSASPQSIIESRRYLRRWWEVEPNVGRVVDGLAHRVDRLAAIGEGQVPAVAAAAWQLLKGQQ